MVIIVKIECLSFKMFNIVHQSPESKYTENVTEKSYLCTRFGQKIQNPWKIILQSIKIHVDYRLTKKLKYFTKLNSISDYGKLSRDAFADLIIILFQVFSETSPTFSVAVGAHC